MDYYGSMALAHWQRWRPSELVALADPETFFTRIGEQASADIDQLTTDLAGDDPPGETYLEKVGRLRMVRFTAEGQILREQILLPPEGETEAASDPLPLEYDEETQTPTGSTFHSGWLPIEMTPDHPAYHDFDFDPLLRRVPANPTT